MTENKGNKAHLQLVSSQELPDMKGRNPLQELLDDPEAYARFIAESDEARKNIPVAVPRADSVTDEPFEVPEKDSNTTVASFSEAQQQKPIRKLRALIAAMQAGVDVPRD